MSPDEGLAVKYQVKQITKLCKKLQIDYSNEDDKPWRYEENRAVQSTQTFTLFISDIINMDLSMSYLRVHWSTLCILYSFVPEEQTIQNMMKCCIMFSKEFIQFGISCKHCAVIRLNMALPLSYKSS